MNSQTHLASHDVNHVSCHATEPSQSKPHRLNRISANFVTLSGGEQGSRFEDQWASYFNFRSSLLTKINKYIYLTITS